MRKYTKEQVLRAVRKQMLMDRKEIGQKQKLSSRDYETIGIIVLALK